MPRGARRLPDACVRELAGAELIVHAGDFVAASVLDELEQLARVAAVRGNMDDAALQARLPERGVAEAAGLRIGIVHDAGPRAGRAQRLVRWFPGCEIVVYGHSHVPELTREGNVWILNPGSPTERRRAPARAMAVVEMFRPRLVELP